MPIPFDFISKWRAIELTESAASHSHFIDCPAGLGVGPDRG
jgi:hypothetical protein